MKYLVLLVAAACGAKGPQGDPGPDGDGAPAIAGVTPSIGLLDRELDVAIAGSESAFDATSTVSFGAGVTVTATTLVSTAAIVAHISIDAAATIGSRDVIVTTDGASLMAAAGFAVAPAIAVDVVAGTPQQGGIAQIALRDRDTNLFDDGTFDDEFALLARLFEVGGDASPLVVQDIEPQDATGTVVFAPLAPAHASIVGMNLDPVDGATPVLTFANDPSMLPIAARPATALTATAAGTIAAPYASLVYRIPTTGPAIVTVDPEPAPGSPAFPFSWIYGAGGTSADLISTFGNLVPIPIASASSVYAVVFGEDLSGSPQDTITTTPNIVPAALNAELATAHGSIGTAQALVPADFGSSIVITGALATSNELDVYKIGIGGTALALSVIGPPGLEIAITDDPNNAPAVDIVIPRTRHYTLFTGSIPAGIFYLEVKAAAGAYTIGLQGGGA